MERNLSLISLSSVKLAELGIYEWSNNDAITSDTINPLIITITSISYDVILEFKFEIDFCQKVRS